MRWLAALGLAVGSTIVLACGGPPFALEADDATASDATSELARDVSAEDVTGESSDGPSRDGRDGSPVDAGAQDVLDGGSGNAGDGDATSAFDASDGQASDGPRDAPPPHCGAGFTCVPAVPMGWLGPFEFYAGTDAGADAAPNCGADFTGQTVEGASGLAVADTTCACSCDPPMGVQCSSPAETFYATSAACTLATSCASAALSTGVCTPVDVTGPCLSGALGVVMSAPASTPSQGGCVPVGDAGLPNPTWSTHARACNATVAPPQADCPAGSVCAPAPGAPFRTGLCVEQAGNIACPSTDASTGYAGKTLVYGAVADTRACSACSCGGVTGASCAASIDQFSSTDGGCMGLPVTYGLPSSCSVLQQPADLRLTLTPSGGSCLPSSSTPTGSAQPANPMTFCCAP